MACTQLDRQMSCQPKYVRKLCCSGQALHIQAAWGRVWSNDGHAQLGCLPLNAALLDHILIRACEPAQVVDDLQGVAVVRDEKDMVTQEFVG